MYTRAGGSVLGRNTGAWGGVHELLLCCYLHAQYQQEHQAYTARTVYSIHSTYTNSQAYTTHTRACTAHTTYKHTTHSIRAPVLFEVRVRASVRARLSARARVRVMVVLLRRGMGSRGENRLDYLSETRCGALTARVTHVWG